MNKKRIPETNEGIQGQLSVEIFDSFARGMRDKGLLHVESYLNAGICTGSVLEIGPGPGYVGLEWMKKSRNAKLTCLEISPDMIKIAHKNAVDYGFLNGMNYVTGNCMDMPFEDEQFDGVFSNGSMHEWEYPEKVFDEIFRVLKPNGRFCITDLRRDINILIRFLAYHTTQPKEIRPGFITSLNASYTKEEIYEMIKRTKFKNFEVTKDFMGLTISGQKR